MKKAHFLDTVNMIDVGLNTTDAKGVDMKILKNRKRFPVKAKNQKVDKLSDPKYDSQLSEKYALYRKPGLNVVKDEIINAWMYINNIFNSQEFQKTGTWIVSPHARGESSYVRENLTKSIVDSSNYFREYKNSVEVKANVPNIQFTIAYGLGKNPSENEMMDNARDKAEEMLQKFFPLASFPSNWSVKQQDQENPGFGKVVITDFKGAELSKRISLEYLEDMNVEYTPQPSWNGPTNYEVSDKYRSNFGGTVNINLSIPKESVRVNQSAVAMGRDNGSLARAGMLVSFEIVVDMYLRFPIEYALWSTSCTTRDEFIEKTFFDHINTLWIRTILGDKVNKLPERVSNLNSIYEKNDKSAKEKNFNPKPRTNKEDYAILNNGKIAWIPNVSNVQDYTKTLRAFYDTENHVILNNAQVKKLTADNPSIKTFTNKAIYTDWYYNKFSYVNDTGKLVIENLEGCIPLDNITIHRIMDQVIWNDDENKPFTTGNFFSILNTKAATDLSGIMDEMGAAGGRKFHTIDSIITYLKNSNVDVTFYNLVGKPLDEDDEEVVGPVVKLLREVVKKMGSRFSELKLSFYQQMYTVRFGFDLFNAYGKNYEKYQSADRKAKVKNNVNYLNKNNNEKLELNLPTIENLAQNGFYDVPNAKNLESILPHQANYIAKVGIDSPKLTVLFAMAGSGKSLMMIVQSLVNLYNGSYKRPLIIPPSNKLTNEFITQIQQFCGDQVNVFPLTLETVRKMRDQLGWDSDKIVEYIRNMPRNTIFVTNGDFIKNRSNLDTGVPEKPMMYVNQEHSPFPNVELLRRIEFDVIFVDESQSIRNKSSQRTKATSSIISEAKYRGISTGTGITNNPKDLVGQANILNPAIFMGEDAFAKNYGILDRKSNSKVPKVIGWQSNIGSRIRNDMLPYVQYHQKNRSEWSFVLPKIQESFIAIENLTQPQKEYYENMMAMAFDKIKQNPTLMKKLKEGNPEDAEEIERQLDRHLSKVEVFINAPDSNQAFVNSLEPDDEENLKSVKVDKVDELISAHFKGGTVDGTHFEADKGKVIVFSYNVDVSKHLYKHSKYKSLALHYTAGNAEILDEFKNNDSKYKILFADESGINVGLNLQVASHLIRIQALWNPGDEEQALHRILRPDLANLYDRKFIRYTRLVAQNTIEIPKLARLISKIIDKAKADHGEKLPRTVNNRNLELIKMNLDVINDYRTFDDLETSTGDNYFDAYTAYRNWEDRQSDQVKENYRKYMEKKLDRKIDDEELIELLKIPTTSNTKIPGSEKVWVPRNSGISSLISTEKGVKVEPASILEYSADDGEEETYAVKENRKVQIGDLVDTEFGPGVVEKVLVNDVYVRVKGISKKMKLPKSVIGVPIGKKSKKKLREIYNSNLGTSSLPKGLNPDSISKEDVNTDDEEDINDVHEQNEKTTPNSIRVELSIIDGMPTLWTASADADIPVITKQQAWKVIPPFVYAQVVRSDALYKLINTIEKKGIAIHPNSKENMLTLAEKLKSERNRIVKDSSVQNITTRWRSFFRNSYRRVRDKNMVRLYPFIWEGKVYLAFTKRTHNPAVTNKLMRISNFAGFRRFTDNDNEIMMFPFRKRVDAKNELNKIHEVITVENFDDTMEAIQELRMLTKS